MSIRVIGNLCGEAGCPRPEYRDGRCGACYQLARAFGKGPIEARVPEVERLERLWALEPVEGRPDARA